jgi:phage terminase large subunit-like protein
VAALFESGRAKLAGAFPALEDELAGLAEGGGYEGPGRGPHRSGTSMGSRSPDRADAMVWAMRELMLGKAEKVPQLRRL